MACIDLTVKDLTMRLSVAASRVCVIVEPDREVIYLCDSDGARLLDSDNNTLVIYE